MKEIMNIPVAMHLDEQLAEFRNLASDCYSATVSPYKYSGFPAG
jgi:hypothetical protein